MKTGRNKLRMALALLLCMTIGFAAFPAYAIMPNEPAMDKLNAFWQQEAANGMTNGDAVYDIDWSLPADHYVSFGGNYPKYDGSWSTPLVYMDVLEGFIFMFGWRVAFWDLIETPNGQIAVDGYDYVYPDLYGDLDLSGTNVAAVVPYVFYPEGGDGISTHISSVELDDCSILTDVRLVGQRNLETVSALNDEELESFRVLNCTCKEISFKTVGLAEPLRINTLGNGYVGAEYTVGLSNAIAEQCGDEFIGWYAGGNRVSTMNTVSYSAGGTLTAVFGGDANGDHDISSADALIIMRAAMGIESGLDVNAVDINVNGGVDSADALSVLRLVMGVM